VRANVGSECVAIEEVERFVAFHAVARNQDVNAALGIVNDQGRTATALGHADNGLLEPVGRERLGI
jgi:hypothetical protein